MAATLRLADVRLLAGVTLVVSPRCLIGRWQAQNATPSDEQRSKRTTPCRQFPFTAGSRCVTTTTKWSGQRSAEQDGVSRPSCLVAAERPDYPRVGHRRRGDSPDMSTVAARSSAISALRRRAGEATR
jgi:hypothetical protein